MNPARVSLGLAIGIVFLGIAAGGAAYLSTIGVSVQPAHEEGFPPSLDWMPESASLVGHLDVRALASSPLWETALGEWNERETAAEIHERTGIDVFRDVDAVSFALAEGGEGAKRPRWGLAVTGGFDAESVARRLGESGVSSEEYEGARVYRIGDVSSRDGIALATAEDSTLLLGEDTFLREMIDAGSGRRPQAKSLVSGWGYDSVAGATFWATGQPSPTILSELGGLRDVPPLESFLVSGRVGSDLSLQARGRARDVDSAQKLADVLRGLVALGRLQGGSEISDLSRLADGVSIELVEREIEVGLSVSYDTLRRLAERPAPKAAQ